MVIQPIAYYHSLFKSKFGVPKQSGLVNSLQGTIVFEKQYRSVDYIRGLDGFDYLWLLWHFSDNRHAPASPLVRPPLLGGNKTVGVFASRSPYRPNPIGLSSVKLINVELETDKGPLLHISGADLIDGTPIFDIKPYLEYADSHTCIRSGFVDSNPIKKLKVIIEDDIRNSIDNEMINTISNILSLDPRPHYHNSPNRVYVMDYADLSIHFQIDGEFVRVVEFSKI